MVTTKPDIRHCRAAEKVSNFQLSMVGHHLGEKWRSISAKINYRGIKDLTGNRKSLEL